MYEARAQCDVTRLRHADARAPSPNSLLSIELNAMRRPVQDSDAKPYSCCAADRLRRALPHRDFTERTSSQTKRNSPAPFPRFFVTTFRGLAHGVTMLVACVLQVLNDDIHDQLAHRILTFVVTSSGTPCTQPPSWGLYRNAKSLIRLRRQRKVHCGDWSWPKICKRDFLSSSTPVGRIWPDGSGTMQNSTARTPPATTTGPEASNAAVSLQE